LFTAWSKGKFHGLMAATTPNGSCSRCAEKSSAPSCPAGRLRGAFLRCSIWRVVVTWCVCVWEETGEEGKEWRIEN
jgi:hypothetical protein